MYQSEQQGNTNLQDMKRKILAQIDRTIEDSPVRVQENSNGNGETVFQNNAPQNRHISSVSTDQDETYSKNSKRFKSPSTVDIMERFQDENNYKMRNRSTLPNDDLEMMKQRLLVTQETIKSRDKAISDLTQQLQNTRSLVATANNQSREIILERSQEEMHNTILHLKNKLSLRKAHIAELK